MTQKEIVYASQIFGWLCRGRGLTDTDRATLQAILDRMTEPERAGAIAAIIKIMCE